MTILTPKPITITGTPDPQPAPDRELLSLSNTFLPLLQPPVRLTTAKRIRRDLLRAGMRRRSRKRNNHVPSPILSPILPASPDPSERDSDSSLAIHYKAHANHRPEMGESNAESREREERINEDITRLKNQRDRKQKRNKQHSLTKTLPTVLNNAQEVEIAASYNLYESHDKRKKVLTQDILYDTGAGLTMISGTYPWAWTNLHDCMYALGGCFVGITYPNLQIGEYHGIMTLDSGESVRVIIPEAVQIPIGTAHSNLLANTAFLLAGHKFISDLRQPKLKFQGGGQYTMSVIQGHNVFTILPITANEDTAHYLPTQRRTL